MYFKDLFSGVCVSYMCAGASRIQNWVSDTLELELHTVMICLVLVFRTELGPFGNMTRTLKCRATVSPYQNNLITLKTLSFDYTTCFQKLLFSPKLDFQCTYLNLVN